MDPLVTPSHSSDPSITPPAVYVPQSSNLEATSSLIFGVLGVLLAFIGIIFASITFCIMKLDYTRRRILVNDTTVEATAEAHELSKRGLRTIGSFQAFHARPEHASVRDVDGNFE
jgi:hypothetical protein